MRKIKFRGKRAYDGEWVYGVPVFFPDNSVYLVRIGWMMLEKTSIIPETLGQYTGLHDRNGKEIYKGDVVEDSKGRGEVLWVQEHCSFLVAVAGGFFRLENGNAEYRLTETEVIGNIHENPELLDERRQE